MKKILITLTLLLIPACACFDGGEAPEERVVYTKTAAAPAPENCDYFDGTTCYRYVRRQRVVAAPAVVRYRESRPAVVQYRESTPAIACAEYVEPASNADSSCAPKIRETREPVEVVYRKTTYKTVYEPKTYTSVSYEKSPYVAPRSESVCATSSCLASEPEYVELNNEEEILLNVK